MPKTVTEIVIHCPGKRHAEERVKLTCPSCGQKFSMTAAGPDTITCRECRTRVRKADGELQPAKPRILMIAQPGSAGVFKMHCPLSGCGREHGENYNGWYEIELKAAGTYTIRPLPKQHFEIRPVPSVLLAGER